MTDQACEITQVSYQMSRDLGPCCKEASDGAVPIYQISGWENLIFTALLCCGVEGSSPITNAIAMLCPT
jgi:hypothetical protein